MRPDHRKKAFSLIEVILALGIVAVVVLSGVMLLGNSLKKIQSLEQENEYESGLAALREYCQRAGAAEIQKAVDGGSPVAVVFYGAKGGADSNWQEPLPAGGASPPEFVGGLPQTAIIANPTSATLQKYLPASRGSSYLVYFTLSPLEGQELTAAETNGVKRALLTQAKFFRYANLDVLASQLGGSPTNKRPDFIATLAIHP